jgi:hypothetical protein
MYVTSRTDLENLTLAANRMEPLSLCEPHAASQMDSLRQLLNDLPPVPERELGFTRQRSAVSVPSPWAAFITFDEFLLGGGGSFGAFTRQAVRDFRALLAILALKTFWGLNVSLNAVKIKSFYGQPVANPHDKAFFDTLLQLRPASAIFDNPACWNDFVFIELKGRVIGALSNSSIVCSSYAYEKNGALMRLGLMAEDETGQCSFADPANLIAADAVRALYMKKWLAALQALIRMTQGPGHARGLICQRIQEFIQDIDESASASGLAAQTEQLDREGFVCFRLPESPPENIRQLMSELTPVFDFSIPLIEQSAGAEDLNVYLLDALDPALKRVLLDGSIEKTGVQAQDDYWTADDIFLDTLTLIDCSVGGNHNFMHSAFYENARVEIAQPGKDFKSHFFVLWPLSADILDRAPARLLRERIRYEKVNDDFIVSLRLTTRGGASVRLRKIYPPGACLKLIDLAVPYIALWPYVRLTDANGHSLWNEFYIYTSISDRDRRCALHWDKNLCPSVGNTFVRQTPDDSVRRVERFDKLPTTLTLTDEMGRQNYGTILLKEPYAVTGGSQTWEIGFDFGTTATTAFARRTDLSAQPEFVRFGETYKSGSNYDEVAAGRAENFLHVLTSHQHNRAETVDFFMPYRYFDRTAYPSILQIDASREDWTRAGDMPLINANVLFEFQRMIYDNPYIKYNIKWAVSASEKRDLAAYLSQMMTIAALMLAVKGAKSVRWKFSYPTSLPIPKLNSYKQTAEHILNRISSENGVECFCKPEEAFYPESIVSAMYFEDKAKSVVFGCMDIGGGSSDISFWTKKGGQTPVNLAQASVSLASRRIFLPAMCELIISPDRNDNDENARDLQDKVGSFSVVYRESIEKTKANIHANPTDKWLELDKFSVEMEPAISRFSDEFRQSILGMSEDHEGLIKFKRRIFFGFFAIAYYALLTLRLAKDAVERSGVHNIDIYLGGNGSKIHTWIPSGVLSNMAVALGQVMSVGVHFKSLGADDLKTEAARGLLLMDDIRDDNFKKQEKLAAGEAQIVKFFGKDDVLIESDADLMALPPEIAGYFLDHENSAVDEIAIDPDLIAIRNFILLFNERIVDAPSLKIELSQDDWRVVQDAIKNSMMKNVRESRLDPPFIIAVEAVLGVLS